jgi:hypothetical protein
LVEQQSHAARNLSSRRSEQRRVSAAYRSPNSAESGPTPRNADDQA